MFDLLLDLSPQDDSNKWSNIGCGEEIGILDLKICISSGALQCQMVVETKYCPLQVETQDFVCPFGKGPSTRPMGKNHTFPQEIGNFQIDKITAD